MDTPGTRLKLSGWVLTPDCQPVPGAVLDFWQADAEGNYDNTGFHLRGHQRTERNGVYTLDTVKPAPYWAFPIRRTPHLHVKVQAEGMQMLTTQLYFPDEMEHNRSDHLFHPELLVDISTSSTQRIEARFDIILERI
jgi:protocatechuate 3,4-dioxygenase beta subunit